MKFIRRTEGVKAARLIFKRARDDQRCTYHIYVASALMEYYCSKVRLTIYFSSCLYVHFYHNNELLITDNSAGSLFGLAKHGD
jgi:hypothetical protein